MTLPIALYIHVPWCIRKCPYCDFNSHKSPETLPEDEYINALIDDFRADVSEFPNREITSIFIGGGTPSLFSAKSYERLLCELNKISSFVVGIEITLEANPGTIEQRRFNEYKQLGINRLSLGIQSFNAEHLKALGRIHDDKQAYKAIKTARKAGFDNINIDLMYGLPKQSPQQGLSDLVEAMAFAPEHLSWYQLTIEPNTLFYKYRPSLPKEDDIEVMDLEGLHLITSKGYQRYEISAFSQTGKFSAHNLNYWLFGDYFGIGAGAHGKITTHIDDAAGDMADNGLAVYRTRKHRQPRDYLKANQHFLVAKDLLSVDDLLFEFMLNTTRLEQPINSNLFCARTGLAFSKLEPLLIKAFQQGLLKITDTSWQVTPLGRRYTNDLQALFLASRE